MSDFDLVEEEDKDLIFYLQLWYDLKIKHGVGTHGDKAMGDLTFDLINNQRGCCLKDSAVRLPSYGNLYPQCGSIELEFLPLLGGHLKNQIIFQHLTNRLENDRIRIELKYNRLNITTGICNYILDQNIKYNEWNKVQIKWDKKSRVYNLAPHFYLSDLEYPFSGYIRNLKIWKVF